MQRGETVKQVSGSAGGRPAPGAPQFRLLLLLALVAAPQPFRAAAGDLNGRLAMLDYQTPPARAAAFRAVARPAAIAVSTPTATSHPAPAKKADRVPERRGIVPVPLAQSKKKSVSWRQDLMCLTRRNPRARERSRTWTSIEAGYGDVFDEYSPPVHEHNGTGWEEPSWGYLKINFRF